MIRFFIDRPIFSGVLSIIITVAGVMALLSLPIAQYPKISPPTVSVSAMYTGANAEVVGQTVATPLEQQINGAQDMLYMSSMSGNDGVMNLTVTFDIGRDLDMATVDVQNRVAMAESTLPDDVQRTGVTVSKQSPDMLMVVNVISPTNRFDNLFLTNYAKINLSDALSRIPGVGSVTVFGAGGDYSMRIWLDPSRMADLKVTPSDVAAAIADQNVQAPAGSVGKPPTPMDQEFELPVQVHGRLSDADQFLDIVVKSGDAGTLVRVKDIAKVELGAIDYSGFSRINSQPTASIIIYQLPGANALDTAEQIKAAMKEHAEFFPDGVEYLVAFDTTRFVNASINEVMETLWEAFALVIIVVFVFLQSWRATLAPTITVPVSLVGTFALFSVLGFSINTLSLFGIVLAIGLVVDDAIVVVEAVQRLIDEEGLPPRQAAYKAMQEVTGPIIGTSLVLAAVFVPVAFMGGVTGQLYQQFALTLTVSVLISTINALTLSPALCALLLKPAGHDRGLLAIFFRGFNRVFDIFSGGYVRGVGAAVRHKLLSMLVLFCIAGGAWFIIQQLPQSFVPEEDQGYMIGAVQLPSGASLERTNAVMRKVEEYFKDAPGVDHILSLGGMSIVTGANNSYSASIILVLAPWDKRTTPDLSLAAIQGRAMAAMSKIPEARIMLFNPPPITGMGMAGGFTFMLQARTGQSPKELEGVLQKFLAAANQRPEIAMAYSSYSASAPQIEVDVDRDKALSMGVDLREVFTALQTFLGGYYVNDFNKFGRTYRVMLQAESKYRLRAEQISDYYVRSNRGVMVPLSTLVSVKRVSGPEFISHFNIYSSAQINGSAAPGYSSGQAMQALRETADKTLPQGYGFDWSGMSYQEASQGNQALIAFGLSIAMVFLFLAALYESWLTPLAVLLSVPVAVCGAMAGLYIRGLDNNVYAQIGLVMLIGLAAKNAILIVEFAIQKRQEGASIKDAALEAARLRFRPILMTSFAFVLGVLPLVLASGAGASSRHALGTAVFSGMLAATFIGIFFIPALYALFTRKGKEEDKPAAEETPADENASLNEGDAA